MHQAITCTNIDLSSMRFIIQLRAIPHKSAQTIILYEFENDAFENTAPSPRGQWAKIM